MKKLILFINTVLIINLLIGQTTGEGVEVVPGSLKINLGGDAFTNNRTINLGTKSLIFSKPPTDTVFTGSYEPFLNTKRLMQHNQNSIVLKDESGLGLLTDVPLEIGHKSLIQPDGTNNNMLSIGLNTSGSNSNSIGMGIYMEPRRIYSGSQWIDNHYELSNINDAETTKTNLRLWSSQYVHRQTRQESSHVFDLKATVFSYSDLFSNEKISFGFGGNNSTTVKMGLLASATSSLNIQSASKDLWLINTPSANQQIQFDNWKSVNFNSFQDSKQFDVLIIKKDVTPASNNTLSLGRSSRLFKDIWSSKVLSENVSFGEKAFYESPTFVPPARLYGVAVGNTKNTKLVSFKGYNNASTIMEILENNAIIMHLPTYNSIVEATAAGLLNNQLFKTSSGVLMVNIIPIN